MIGGVSHDRPLTVPGQILSDSRRQQSACSTMSRCPSPDLLTTWSLFVRVRTTSIPYSPPPLCPSLSTVRRHVTTLLILKRTSTACVVGGESPDTVPCYSGEEDGPRPCFHSRAEILTMQEYRFNITTHYLTTQHKMHLNMTSACMIWNIIAASVPLLGYSAVPEMRLRNAGQYSGAKNASCLPSRLPRSPHVIVSYQPLCAQACHTSTMHALSHFSSLRSSRPSNGSMPSPTCKHPHQSASHTSKSGMHEHLRTDLQLFICTLVPAQCQKSYRSRTCTPTS